MEASTSNSGEKAQNTADGVWQKMAEEAGSFQNPSKEKVQQKEIDARCIQDMRRLLESESLDPIQSFGTLEQYAQGRAKSLGVDKKIHLYLRYEYWTKINEHSSGLAKIRYNPKTKEVYNQGKWGFWTRAYHDPEKGTFLDFKAVMNGDAQKPFEKQRKTLTGYERAYAIIDYAYTCEHELTHDIQQQMLDNKEVSFDALRIARDFIMLRCLSAIKGGNYFYQNAHNDFFIETEANDAADDFLSKIIPIGGTIDREKANPDAPEKFQKTIGEILDNRSHEARIGEGATHTLSTEETTLKIPKKVYSGFAEDVISDFCDDVIKSYPGLLSEYPALLLEYNKDGSRRSREDIEAAIDLIDNSDKTMFAGKEIDSKRVKIAYHRLLRHSRKLQKGANADLDGAPTMEEISTGKAKE